MIAAVVMPTTGSAAHRGPHAIRPRIRIGSSPSAPHGAGADTDTGNEHQARSRRHGHGTSGEYERGAGYGHLEPDLRPAHAAAKQAGGDHRLRGLQAGRPGG